MAAPFCGGYWLAILGMGGAETVCSALTPTAIPSVKHVAGVRSPLHSSPLESCFLARRSQRHSCSGTSRAEGHSTPSLSGPAKDGVGPAQARAAQPLGERTFPLQ